MRALAISLDSIRMNQIFCPVWRVYVSEATPWQTRYAVWQIFFSKQLIGNYWSWLMNTTRLLHQRPLLRTIKKFARLLLPLPTFWYGFVPRLILFYATSCPQHSRCDIFTFLWLVWCLSSGRKKRGTIIFSAGSLLASSNSHHQDIYQPFRVLKSVKVHPQQVLIYFDIYHIRPFPYAQMTHPMPTLSFSLKKK